MAFIGKEVLQKRTLKRKEVFVPEWDGTVLLHELSGQEAIPINQGALEIQRDTQAGKASARRVLRWWAETVVAGWINEDGGRVLEDGDIDTFIDNTGNSIIERLSTEIRILSGLQRTPADANKDAPTPVEEAKKNSVTTRNGASGSR